MKHLSHCLLLSASLFLVELASASPLVSTGKPANLFQASEPVVLAVSGVEPGDYEWRVDDWLGAKLRQGSIRLPGELRFDDLPLGYFELRLKPKGQDANWPEIPFARIVDLKDRAVNPDSPYAVDGAQTLIAQDPPLVATKLQPPDIFELASDLTQLAGITLTRERSWWVHGTNPVPGDYRLEVFEKNTRNLNEHGVKTLSMYQGVPEWARRRDGKIELTALYEFNEAFAKRIGDGAAGWQAYNEMDAKPYIPVWDFAATLKAAYLGFKSGSPDTPVVSAAIANIRAHHRYFDLLLENGVGDFFDIFAFHVYDEPSHYPDIFETLNSTLAKHGLSQKPIWITESGIRTVGARAALEPGGKMTEMSAAQAVAQADRVIKASVGLHARGIEKVFFFVLFPFNENGGSNPWGLLRWDWLVKPGYVSLANLTAQLSDRPYLGTFDAGLDVEAHLFGKADANGAGQQTLVLWSEKDARAVFASSAPELEIVDAMGTSAWVKPVGEGRYSVPVGIHPIYVKGLSGLAPSRPKLERGGTSPASHDRDIVLRINFGDEIALSQNFIRLVGRVEGGAELEIHNFGDTARTGTIRSVGEGCSVSGLPARVTVPPMGSVKVPVKLVLPKNQDRVATLKISGDFDGKKISPLAVPIEPDYFEMMKRAGTVVERELPVDDVKRWAVNAAGPLQIVSDQRERAIKFIADLSKASNKWVYPNYALRSPEQNLAGSVGVSFEIKAQRIDKDLDEILLMALTPEEIAKNRYIRYPFRLSTEWQTIQIQWADNPDLKEPADIRLLRIGCNPRQPEFTYWVRNLKVYYKK